MAEEAPKTLFFFFLHLFAICCSGSMVGFSYDARKNYAFSSPAETLSFLMKNGVPSSQIRVFVVDHRPFDSLSNTGVSVDLCVNKTNIEILQKSKASAVSWVRTRIVTFLPHVKITSILVSSRELLVKNEIHLLPPILNLIRSALKSFDLDRQVKVSAAFPLSMIENSDKNSRKELMRVMDFVRKYQSFIVVETSINGELSLGDQFIKLTVEKAVSVALLPCTDIPMVLNVRSSAVPSAVEVSEFSVKMAKSMETHAQIINRICGLFVEITPMGESVQRELNREEEQIFPSSHRELMNGNNFNLAFKTTVHDTTFTPTTPISNPETTPVTVPSTNPTPTIVTVPSTNPITVLPTNPVSSPVSTPITVPVSTPITVPSTIPVPPPPAAPITNPVITPITVPVTPPITNPVTTYPIPPPGSTPITTPITTPPMPPATTNPPTVSGQSWCMAKTGALDSSLQAALDYACGIGGADCSAIQQTGNCYNPNTLHDHASYAFNSYYQKNPSATSCDFGGTATVVNTNPSTGSCIYPTSSSSASSSTSPTSTSTSPPSTSSSSSSSVLNTNNASSTNVFGPQPQVDPNHSAPVTANLHMMFALASLTSSFITGKLLLIHG
ncbi:uncharacterized threonine-rich GPI-anchored glycoprotein PJ4664.02-like [Magnolia sinica]|uniref:uncharacterized threonine-rich GPI-anchored glycoprotein PJ4664.02-like n=1 Tax=Magnolia sinica TaxID=86752 RepID=UPI00265820B9|nr:uncharacterized threonine-rich GPI-anchored glycoprotein PJ4664.02-like [Magnolia sinica]